MKILSSFNKDTQTHKPKPGSYEWWYFDARSKEGYSLVVIFYDGNPFSRHYIQSVKAGDGKLAEDFPAISISVYKDGKPLFYSFEEFTSEHSSFSQTNPGGFAGFNTFEGEMKNNQIVYEVTLNHKLHCGDQISGKLWFKSEPFDFKQDKGEEPERDYGHAWNLVIPVCEVQGEIQLSGYTNVKIDFEGTGYHDHNYGHEPMKDSFDEWYWGRYHLKYHTLIYYLMNQKGKWKKKAWLIGQNDSFTHLDSEIVLSETVCNLFGLSSARKIEFKKENMSVLLQKDRLIDNGPFYQRFEGRLLLRNEDELLEGRGISEYIRPERIYKRLFWPLVNMRIAYPGKSHWVQRSPRLYRWTW